MQLPFLQHLVPDLRIVPLLMGSQRADEVDASRRRSRGCCRTARTSLLVASSDLSHYHPAPVANRLDALVVGDVERFDPGRAAWTAWSDPTSTPAAAGRWSR